MKSLQNQYNLIKEGKGNKEIFLKEAKAQFPQYFTNAQSFNQVVHSLTERGIINESIVLVSANNRSVNDWFKIFKENTENVKAELKDTDKSVVEKEITGYDYKAKNNNNISTGEMLKGYYAEIKDPKNHEKTEDQIKEIVVKNLEKDPMHYIKDGAFGVKGLGYSDNQPGLGATKEVTGKYKSSRMEPVKLEEKVGGLNKINEYSVYQGDVSKIKPKATPKKGETYLKYLKIGDKFSAGKSEYVVVKPDLGNSGVEVKYADGTGNMKFRGSTIVNLSNQEDYDAGEGSSNIKENKHPLSEAKKRAIEKHIKEIEKASEIAGMDHKIKMIQEKIDELKNKMTMTEGDDMKEYVDKKAISELKKDINLLEKRKVIYEKQKAKAGKRVSDKTMMQTGAGEGTTVMQEKEEEKPFTPPTDPDKKIAFSSMKRDTAPKLKKESWSGMVRELITKKNLKAK